MGESVTTAANEKDRPKSHRKLVRASLGILLVGFVLMSSACVSINTHGHVGGTASIEIYPHNIQTNQIIPNSAGASYTTSSYENPATVGTRQISSVQWTEWIRTGAKGGAYISFSGFPFPDPRQPGAFVASALVTSNVCQHSNLYATLSVRVYFTDGSYEQALLFPSGVPAC